MDLRTKRAFRLCKTTAHRAREKQLARPVRASPVRSGPGTVAYRPCCESATRCGSSAPKMKPGRYPPSGCPPRNWLFAPTFANAFALGAHRCRGFLHASQHGQASALVTAPIAPGPRESQTKSSSHHARPSVRASLRRPDDGQERCEGVGLLPDSSKNLTSMPSGWHEDIDNQL